MSDARGSSVKQHFADGKLKRLDIAMLPRDKDRCLGTARGVLCKSFNYCKQYPAKLALFIEVMKWVTNYAMRWQAMDEARREEVSTNKKNEAIKLAKEVK